MAERIDLDELDRLYVETDHDEPWTVSTRQDLDFPTVVDSVGPFAPYINDGILTDAQSRSNADFVAALVNAWPQISAALRLAMPEAGSSLYEYDDRLGVGICHYCEGLEEPAPDYRMLAVGHKADCHGVKLSAAFAPFIVKD